MSRLQTRPSTCVGLQVAALTKVRRALVQRAAQRLDGTATVRDLDAVRLELAGKITALPVSEGDAFEAVWWERADARSWRLRPEPRREVRA